MAKMTSLSGAVTGKLAGNVYSVSAGQQIVRAYQPNVANPQTQLQVENRTKFKLASQLASAVSPVLAISKQGLISGRNQFVSASMNAIAFALGEATILLNRTQLTKSSIQLPALSVTIGAGSAATINLDQSALPLGVTKVVYVMFKETTINKLELVDQRVVSEAGADGKFALEYGNLGSTPKMIYAYGIIEDENSLLAKYDDYQVEDATFIAKLVSSRSGVASGLKTTTTSYASYIPA
jgi:hypothetical protein